MTVADDQLLPFLDAALTARAALLDAPHQAAKRLFNGFFEGAPDLVVDCYGATLLLHNYADPPAVGEATVAAAMCFLTERLPWVQAVIVKTRNAPTLVERHGVLLFGTKAETRVREHGVWYALDLLAHRDATFYLDTRNLRAWAARHLAERSVLNTFAYTGSLGVAAMAGGARRVVQTDLKREYLNIAKTSYTLNGFPIVKTDFLAGDFWTRISGMKRAGERFDCVFVDPPFFAATGKGTVDLVAQSHRVINKVRPLINDGGVLVAINNALFVSGAAYMQTLDTLCADGYLTIEETIPVPPDCTGYPETRVRSPLVDPAPFNHSTKIAVLRVRRKVG
ncbi:MAG: class I SAM-dependent methyltransferase [Thermomicrobia bacterium]|nr:class I SAM-dependent methyltransferase [Thermomicrobia bacterium]